MDDVAELRRLLSIATRVRVREMLQREIKALEAEVGASEKEVGGGGDGGEESGGGEGGGEKVEEKVEEKVDWKRLTTYAWDQTDDFLKVYLTSGVDGIGSVSDDAVTLHATPFGFDFQAKGLPGGRDVRLVVDNLEKEIDPSDIRVRRKADSATLRFRKKRQYDRFFKLISKKPRRTAKAKKKSTTDDPAAGVVDVLRDLYEDGDDETRRTIAEAWSRSKGGSIASTMPSTFEDDEDDDEGM